MTSGSTILSVSLRRRLVLAFLAFLFVSARAMTAQPSSWSTVGPPGGDARAFASVPGDPNHLYLGTIASWLYESRDGGSTWRRLAKLDPSDDLVLDHIVVDADDHNTLYVAGWHRAEGGLWISHDAGRTWRESPGLHGQSIRAFLQAPSNPKLLLAGTLEGVFRSEDAGRTWTQISQRGSREIHEVESLAVDPGSPETIYAGTWHLPWKTTDGGKTWSNIKQGLIDDSDVFSIILDSGRPHTVFLSACSGIYKSETAGAHFHKIQGIPSTARRTRVLKQDPNNREVVYAGTTEGLYRTTDGGLTFKLLTSDDLIVNDIFIDPRDSKHVLLATDRGGVLASHDAGKTFAVSNLGFSERKVAALLVDRSNPSHLYAGVVNDKNFGSVFVSNDQGVTWAQVAKGLDGRDVFALSQTGDGTVLAGTNSGIFVLDPPANAGASGAPASQLTWEARNTIANTVMKTATEMVRRTRVNVEKEVKVPVAELDSRVNALDVSGDVWLAAGSLGLLTSRDQGATWQGGPVLGAGDFLSVTTHGDLLAAARGEGVLLSRDAGRSWWPMSLPTMLTRIHRVLFTPDGALWLGAREGVYFTRDTGKTWMWIGRLPFRDVDDVEYDAARKRVLVTSRSSDQIYSIDPKTMTWKLWQSGFRIQSIRVAGDRFVAASLDDGVIVGPEFPAAEK